MSPRDRQTKSTTEPRLPLAVTSFEVVTMVSATVVLVTARDVFTWLTMASALAAIPLLHRLTRDPVILLALTTMVFGAVLGWGLNFYDRIWWYDDFVHFLFSLIGVVAIARFALHRFNADPPWLLMWALWLSWLGIGSLWEIGEWAADMLQDTQHSRGYLDTMTDMILNSLGAASGAAIYSRWLAQTPASGHQRPATQ